MIKTYQIKKKDRVLGIVRAENHTQARRMYFETQGLVITELVEAKTEKAEGK